MTCGRAVRQAADRRQASPYPDRRAAADRPCAGLARRKRHPAGERRAERPRGRPVPRRGARRCKASSRAMRSPCELPPTARLRMGRRAPASGPSARSRSRRESRRASSSRMPRANPICSAGTVGETGELPLAPPGRHQGAYRAQPRLGGDPRRSDGRDGDRAHPVERIADRGAGGARGHRQHRAARRARASFECSIRRPRPTSPFDSANGRSAAAISRRGSARSTSASPPTTGWCCCCRS